MRGRVDDRCALVAVKDGERLRKVGKKEEAEGREALVPSVGGSRISVIHLQAYFNTVGL